MSSTIRITRDRVVGAIDKVTSYDELEKLYPALGVVVNEDITTKDIDDMLKKLGYKPVFSELDNIEKITNLGYPPKPELVVTFYIMNQALDPHFYALRELKFDK
jgi:hypothetical protein